MSLSKTDDRVKETTTTTGSGTITLAGAAAGFRAFSSVKNDGEKTFYAIVGSTEWETGIGTFTASGTTISRDIILSSSNANAAVNFSAGSKDVFLTAPALHLNRGSHGRYRAMISGLSMY